MFRFVAVLTIFLVGCQEPSEVVSGPVEGDTSTPDVQAGDTSVPDAQEEDTSAPDAQEEDTSAPDVEQEEVTTPDGFAGDTSEVACGEGDDGDPCVVDDACESAGSCEGTVCVALGPCECTTDSDCEPSSDPCVARGCDLNAHVCVESPKLDVPCDDGNACTTGESCSVDGCTGGSPLTCDDGDACNGLES